MRLTRHSGCEQHAWPAGAHADSSTEVFDFPSCHTHAIRLRYHQIARASKRWATSAGQTRQPQPARRLPATRAALQDSKQSVNTFRYDTWILHAFDYEGYKHPARTSSIQQTPHSTSDGTKLYYSAYCPRRNAVVEYVLRMTPWLHSAQPDRPSRPPPRTVRLCRKAGRRATCGRYVGHSSLDDSFLKSQCRSRTLPQGCGCTAWSNKVSRSRAPRPV